MASPPIQDLTGDDTPMETESGVPAPAETNFDGQDPYSLFINDPDDEAANDVDLTRVEPMTTNLDYASQFPAGVAPDQGEIIMTSALPTSETIEESDPNEVVITGNTTSSNNPQAGRALNAAWKEKLLARQRKYLKPDQIVDLSQETPQSLVNLTSAAPEAPMVPDEAQQEDLEAIQAEFTAAHKEYLRKQASGKLSDLDEVAFIKLQRQFQSKVKKAKEDLRCEVAELGGDAYMSGDDVNMTEVQPGAAQCAAEEGYQAFMSAEASNPLNAPGKGRSNTNANSKAKKGKAAKATAQATTSRGGKGTRGGRVAKPKRPTKKQLEQEKRSRNRTNMDNLFSQNLFRDVQTNTARDDGPTFSVNANATNKKQSALKQLAS